MSSSLFDSNVDEGDEEDAEQLVTTEEAGTSKDLPLDSYEDDFSSYDELEEDTTDETKRKSKSSSTDPKDNAKEYDDYLEPDSEPEIEESHMVEFLKKPPPQTFPTLDDFLEDDDDLAASSNRTSDTPLTRQQAAEIAQDVIQLLEEDLAEYVAKTGITFPQPRSSERKKIIKAGDSSSSFNSNLSDILPGEPSRIRMTYDRGVSVYTDLSLQHLAADEMVDAAVQVHIHRFRKPSKQVKGESFSQTQEMTFLDADKALLAFKRIYPRSEDYTKAEAPSRQASEDLAVQKAKESDPDIDTKRKGPEIISLSNKKQLLQPLMDNYFKEEKLLTGSRFTGHFVNRQFFKGKYDHPTGATIESEFINGHFQSVKHFGIVSYPRGDTFEGEWLEGRYQTGQITFCDGLKFSNNNWKHCEPPDRRFKVENYYGIQPAGKTLFSDQYPPPQIPPGMYDIGDGYYNPKNGDVRAYDGFLMRKALANERIWFEKNCRKVHDTMEHAAPKFLPERIPGSFCDTQKRVPLTKKRYH